MKINKYFAAFWFVITLMMNVFYAQEKRLYWDEVQTIKNFDKIYIPKKNPIIFVGSSSIRLWKNAEKIFEKYDVLNRGIGGAHVDDIIFYANQLILDYKPRQIVIYIGENDLKYASVSADTVFEQTKKLFSIIRHKLPEVPIVYISLKPSPARDSSNLKMLQTNLLMKKYIAKEKNIKYLDVYKNMITKDGNYRPDLFSKDKIHMKAAGYKLWQKALKPYLLK
ncbi:MAG: GDSL family lipase [Flavobacteriia bacterium]|nr:GDSL family lipase [Flavobacteriia bacterium]OIP45227.1 MAG: GDSL family lipase [Flavobacteriaceae bacterium CG2_30_31_66]PIV97525.1 MAG: GDSL family lipase [Flavobacteriaceae bacterium CG17_big_fil_post_rev_8_21_14_2_50_31_13]PIX15354.1 MAG: GDSL family lipase [Flavobacteriaceae bacterium CG_4_8_14_3_um_filter_31_8]PIY14273.1 MAG: GDSL family lipase [Flavobacteriaceae bacterium CG_4_10_14_3_um_filter_31_253]PIZ10125.1 MAG: GDSL family lipase [Flavobacteriaceae bacterium CG_4_10_14_0_8_um_f